MLREKSINRSIESFIALWHITRLLILCVVARNAEKLIPPRPDCLFSDRPRSINSNSMTKLLVRQCTYLAKCNGQKSMALSTLTHSTFRWNHFPCCSISLAFNLKITLQNYSLISFLSHQIFPSYISKLRCKQSSPYVHTK